MTTESYDNENLKLNCQHVHPSTQFPSSSVNVIPNWINFNISTLHFRVYRKRNDDVQFLEAHWQVEFQPDIAYLLYLPPAVLLHLETLYPVDRNHRKENNIISNKPDDRQLKQQQKQTKILQIRKCCFLNQMSCK